MIKRVIALSILIAVLTIIVTSVGIFWQTDGQSFEFTTLRGPTTTIKGSGLYRYDSISFAAQAVAQDIVTLFMGIPLLIAGMIFAWKNSLRGRLLLTGMLGYFLYAYAAYAFGVAYNPLFLIYILLFSLSLFAFILSFMCIDVHEVSARVSQKFPRRGLAVVCILGGAYLLAAWLGGRILPSLFNGNPPFDLDSYTTLVIQALDLGLVAPVAFLSAILLLRKNPWGYLLGSIFSIKTATLATAVSAMVVGMINAGVKVNPVEASIFPLLNLAVLYFTVQVFRNIE